MNSIATLSSLFGSASAAADMMKSFVTPVAQSMVGLAAIAVVLFLIFGGFLYTTSSGNPEKLDQAKKVIRNALIGLAFVVAAGALTAILSHAYAGAPTATAQKLPALVSVTPTPSSNGLVDALTGTITGLLKNLIESAARPFIAGLAFFTHATPLMADNSGVFNLWLVVVGITDALFVLMVALIGFHIMSFSAFGLEEIELKHILPKIGLIFLLINTSLFAIDGVISLSNAMIAALNAAFDYASVWETLTRVVANAGTMGLAALLIMVAFLILSVMLMIYYVLRLVVLYVGAVLSPLALLLWLLPGFKDFVETAAKTYAGTVFVLFIHVVILELAASLFAGMVATGGSQDPNPIMSLIVGLATLLALLKTQSVMSQMSYVSLGPRTAVKLGGQISNVMAYYSGKSLRSLRSHTSGKIV